MTSVKREDVEISKDDQQNINNFSRLNQKFHEKERELNDLKDLYSTIDDAKTEVELGDEDDIRIKFGDCFVRVDKDFCEQYLDKTEANLKEEIDALKFMVEDTQKRMGKLKSTLYTKFGNSIQLEE